MAKKENETVENKTQDKKAASLIQPESDISESVGWKDYSNFLSFGPGAFCGFFIFFGLLILKSLSQLATSFALVVWTEKPLEQQQENIYPSIFCGSVLFYFITSLLLACMINFIVLKSGTNMHNRVTWSVIRAKILFFDSNPIGRILTRFSKDIGMVDNAIAIYVYFVS